MPMAQMTHCMHCEGVEFTALPTDGLEKKFTCLKCGKSSSTAYLGLKWFDVPIRCNNCHHTYEAHVEGGNCLIGIVSGDDGSIVPCPCGGFEK